MTRRLRIYRGIAVLASLVAMGPQMAACEEGPSSSSSKISSRFSTSLEQAAPTSSVVEEERNELIANDNDNSHQRRELLSVWSLVIQASE